MANGQDLGGQLLEALVAAQRQKSVKEELRLREKAIELESKGQQLQGLQYVAPEARTGFLSQLFGAPVQPYVSPQEQGFADLQNYLKANPDVNDMYMRLQTTGTVLPGGEALDAARIASGLKSSFKDRASAIGHLLEQIGSPALPMWNAAIGREAGVRAPTGVKTIPERAVGAEEKRATETGAAAEAARIRARQDAVEFVAGGFQPLPNSPASKDPALAQKYAEEMTKFAMGEQNVVSPEAITQMVPLSKWSAILKAAAEPSADFQKRLTVYKELLDYANKQKGKVPKDMIEQIQTLGQSLYDEVLPPQEGGVPVESGESAFSQFVSGPLGKMIGLLFSPAEGTKAPSITLSGRPLKPELQEALNIGAKAGKSALQRTVLGPAVPLAESVLKILDQAYNKVLPRITKEPNKPPVIQPTVGALSSPEAGSIPPEQKQKLQGLVAAYRAAGGTPEEAAAIESELLQVMKSGDEKAQREYIQALLEDIDTLKSSGIVTPAE